MRRAACGHRSGAAAVVLAVALAVVALAGCGAQTSGRPAGTAARTDAVPAVPAVPGIGAEAVRLRTDETIGGQLQVRLTDTGTAPFTVTAVAIDSPGFAAVPPTPVSTTYQPGQTIDLPTPFGSVNCAAAVEPAAARLTVIRGGAPEEVRVPLTGGTLTLVHGEECAVAAVRAVVDPELAGLADGGDGQSLTGTVLLTRRAGNDPVEVLALGRSVLLKPSVDRDLPVTLLPGENELALPVTVTLASCDPHVLAETKKPFVFPLSIAVADADPVPVDLPVDDAQKATLQQLVDRVCG
jgi:hypothetical protein